MFVRDVTTTARRLYGTGADNRGTPTKNGYNLGSKNNTVVITSRPRTARDKEDDWSDKSISERPSTSTGRLVQSETGVEYGGRKEYGMRAFPGA